MKLQIQSNRQLPVRRATVVAVLVGTAVLGACGGGASGSGAVVNSMSATPVAWGRTVFWSVGGLGLDDGVNMAITSGTCADLVQAGAGASTQRQFTCRAAAVGDIVGEVRDSGGKRLASLRITVPVPAVRLTLSQGTIDIELETEKAPVTVQNFITYISGNFYDATIFHRVINGFVIQGGGYTAGPTFKTPTQPAIALETNRGLNNLRGTIAMARTSAPNSATSQFFINVVDNAALDYKSDAEPGYAVFGRVIAGLDVVDAIKVVPTGSVPALGLADVPLTNVVLTTARQIR